MTPTGHKDPRLNLLRIIAFGAMGYYLYQAQKKQGNLSGVNNADPNWKINPEVIIDYVMPLVPLDTEQKQIISLAGKNLLRGFLQEKGMAK